MPESDTIFTWNGGDDVTDKKVFLKTKECKCGMEQVPEEMQESDITCCPHIQVVERDE